MTHATTHYTISEPGGSFIVADDDSYSWSPRIKDAKVYYGRVDVLAAVERVERIIEARIGRFVPLTVRPRSGGAAVARVAISA